MVVAVAPRASQTRAVIASRQVADPGAHTVRRHSPPAAQNRPAPQSTSVTQSTQREAITSHTSPAALHWADERHSNVATQAWATQRSPAPQSTSAAQVTQLPRRVSQTPPGHMREDSHATRALHTPPRQTGRSLGHSASVAQSVQRPSSAEHTRPDAHSADVRHPAAASIGATTSVPASGAVGTSVATGRSALGASACASAPGVGPESPPLGEQASTTNPIEAIHTRFIWATLANAVTPCQSVSALERLAAVITRRQLRADFDAMASSTVSFARSRRCVELSETAGAFESHPRVSITSAMSSAPPSSPPQSPVVVPIEAALIERARRRDESAFREIFRQHAPRVWRLLRDLLGTRAAADDATQETFVRAHAALLDGAPIERLAPWLFGVARNVSREHLRARSRLVAMADPVDREVPACAADPEAILAGRETGEALASALSVLSHDRRAALLLRTDHELGYDEIAEILGWTLPRVKNEIHRARLQLRAALVAHLNASEDRHAK